MKFLYLNTASAFASDYKSFNYQARYSDWEPTEITVVELWEKYCPSGLAIFERNLNLGCRTRSFSMWICGNKKGTSLFSVITITGIASEARKDFAGRIIYDSLSLINTYNPSRYEHDQFSFVCDQAYIALNALDAFAIDNWSLDSSANQDDFDMDSFAFSDIDRVYSLFSATRECDIRIVAPEAPGLVHQHVLQLLRRLGIDFFTEENRSQKKSEPKNTYFKSDSLRDQIDKEIGNMADVAEEIKDEIEDKVASVLGDKTQVLWTPFRVMKGLFKRPQHEQSKDSKAELRRRKKENHLTSKYIYITCTYRPSRDIINQLQCGIFNIWASNPSAAIGLSIGGDFAEPSSIGIDIHRQSEMIVITIP